MPAIIKRGELGDSEQQSNQTHILCCLGLGSENNSSGTHLGRVSETVPFPSVCSALMKQLCSGTAAHLPQVLIQSLPSDLSAFTETFLCQQFTSTYSWDAGCNKSLRWRHSHRTCTPHKHWRGAVQDPNPFLAVKTHSYFSSIKTKIIAILSCQPEVNK